MPTIYPPIYFNFMQEYNAVRCRKHVYLEWFYHYPSSSSYLIKDELEFHNTHIINFASNSNFDLTLSIYLH